MESRMRIESLSSQLSSLQKEVGKRLPLRIEVELESHLHHGSQPALLCLMPLVREGSGFIVLPRFFSSCIV